MTLHNVDFSQPLWRYLYQPLYQRVLDYALAQGETEESVVHKFILLHSHDPTIHLIVDVDNNSFSTIKSHCLIQVLINSLESKHALILQLTSQKGSDFLEQCLDYISGLKTVDPSISKILLITNEKDFRQLKKKYSLTVAKVVLEKVL